MNITVHLGEPFWRAVGQRDVRVSLATNATAAHALTALSERYPALAAELDNGEAQPALFINDEAAQPDSPLAEGARVYVVWPVSGG